MAEALNDVNYENITHTSGISTHHFPRDVTVWPK